MPPSVIETLSPALPPLDTIETGLHTSSDTLRELVELAQTTGAPDFDFLLEASDGSIVYTDVFLAIDKLLEAGLISQERYDNALSTYSAILNPQDPPGPQAMDPNQYFIQSRAFTPSFSANRAPSNSKHPALLLQDLVIVMSQHQDLTLSINNIEISVIHLILEETGDRELLQFRDVLIKKLIRHQYCAAQNDAKKSQDGSKTKRSTFVTNLQKACAKLTDEQLQIMHQLVSDAISPKFADQVFPDPLAETITGGGIVTLSATAEELPPPPTESSDQTLIIVIRILNILAGGKALTNTGTNMRDQLHLLQQETVDNGASIRGLEDHMSNLGEGIKQYLAALVGDVAKASPRLKARLRDHTIPEPNSLTGIADRVETTHHQLAVILDLLILKLGALQQPLPMQQNLSSQLETMATTLNEQLNAITQEISSLRQPRSWKRIAALIAGVSGLIGATALSTWLLVRQTTETMPSPQTAPITTPLHAPEAIPATAPSAPPTEPAPITSPPTAAPTAQASTTPPKPSAEATPKTISVTSSLSNATLTFKETETKNAHTLNLVLPQNGKVTLVPAKSGFRAYLKVVVGQQKGLIWIDTTVPENINNWKPETANFRNEEDRSVWKNHNITIHENKLTVSSINH